MLELLKARFLENKDLLCSHFTTARTLTFLCADSEDIFLYKCKDHISNQEKAGKNP